MKLVKSLLLSSAVGITAVASAQAADLPFRKAAPVEYVRVCDYTGAGYFYLPGTDTCLKIGGFVRAEYVYVSPSTYFFPQVGAPSGNLGQVFGPGTIVPSQRRPVSGFLARGRLDMDARTQTAYGTLRTFFRFEMTRIGGAYTGSTTDGVTNLGGQTFNLDKAFIQYAGFTAGRVQSFFDFYADNYNYEGIANSDASTQAFAYTATFGGGFSATIAVEDPDVRRNGIRNLGTFNNQSQIVQQSDFGYGSERIPDIVGVLRYDQAWGAVQLSGAYHELVAVSPTVANVTRNDDGFAVQAGVQIKLPMLAAGDDIWLQGAYQQGAYSYQDQAGNLNSGTNSGFIGGFQHLDADAYAFVNANGSLSLSKAEGFSVAGALHHYFTPNFSDVLFGSYQEISYGSRARNTPWFAGGIGDASSYRIGNQFIWTPVNNLSIGIEAVYAHIDQDIAGGAAARAAIPFGIDINPSSFEGRFRVERDF